VVLKLPEKAGDVFKRALQDYCREKLAPYNIRAGSNFAPNCRKPRPERFSAFDCGPRRKGDNAPLALTLSGYY
jgi:hypothetical protein